MLWTISCAARCTDSRPSPPRITPGIEIERDPTIDVTVGFASASFPSAIRSAAVLTFLESIPVGSTMLVPLSPWAESQVFTTLR